MKLKRFFTLLVTAVMLLGLMGIFSSCGANEGLSKLVDGKFTPAITVTYTHPFISGEQNALDDYNKAYGDGSWTITDNSWLKLAKEEYGINLRLAWEVFSGSDYLNKLDNAVFVGEIPDIVNTWHSETAVNNVKKLYKQKLIQSLDEAIENYACEAYKNTVESVGEQVFYSVTYEGKKFALPHIVPGNSGSNLFWIRQDWLEAVNKHVPTNWQEFKDVLYAFTYQDPDGNNIDDTYGFTVNLGNAGKDASMWYNIFGAHPDMWIEDDTGKLVYGSVQPEMKTAISELRDLYTSGIIYPESISNTHYLGTVQGYAGCLSQGPGYVTVFTPTKKNNSATEFTCFGLFSEDGGDAALDANLNFFCHYVVSKDCKYPEALVVLMNMYCDIATAATTDAEISKEYIRNPVTSIGYSRISPVLTALAPDPDNNPQQYMFDALKTGDTTHLDPSQLSVYNNIMKYRDEGNLDCWWYDRLYYANEYLADNPVELMRTYFQGAKTDKMLELETDLLNALSAGIVLIIIGEMELDYFDILVEAWYDGGGREITADVNAWYSEMIG